MQPRKIDLLSPETETVKIETSTGGTAFKNIASFRLFNETFQSAANLVARYIAEGTPLLATRSGVSELNAQAVLP